MGPYNFLRETPRQLTPTGSQRKTEYPGMSSKENGRCREFVLAPYYGDMLVGRV